MININFINIDVALQCVCGVLGIIFCVVTGALSSWLKKFMEAFLTAVIGDPKKLGERAGRWVRSRNSNGDDAPGVGGA